MRFLLRRTSRDELPQFINVLQGRMSVVPRPHAAAHNEEYRHLIGDYMLRHKVKPGITGWAQVNGWRGETEELYEMEKRIEYGMQYIRNWSVWLDIKIVLLTLVKGFWCEKACTDWRVIAETTGIHELHEFDIRFPPAHKLCPSG